MNNKIKANELIGNDNPYQKLLALGPESLSDVELLAIIIKSGTKDYSAIDLARLILKNNGGNISSLNRYTVAELTAFPGIGQVKAIQILSVLELSKRLSEDSKGPKDVYDRPSKFAKRYMERLRHKDSEYFLVIMLDNQKHLIKDVLVSIGTKNATLAGVPEIFKAALKEGACSIVCMHNHPAGDSSPSERDIETTEKIKAAGEFLGIPLIDHIIIGDKTYFSFRQSNLVI